MKPTLLFLAAVALFLAQIPAIAQDTTLTITPSGNVGIGKAAPAYKLDVNGQINATGVLVNGTPVGTGSGGQWTTSGSTIYYAGGRVGIGSPTPATQLSNNGNNILGSDGYGLSSTSLGWESAGFGYAAGFYNPGTGNGGGGVVVKIDGTTSPVLDLMSGSTSVMTVKGNGLVGIGTKTPTRRLEVFADLFGISHKSPTFGSDVTTYCNSTGGWIGTFNDFPLFFYTHNSGAQIALTTAGNVGIGTIAPSQKLSVVGSICYTGSIGACSDLRYKKNIVPLSGALDKVSRIQGVTYDWKTEEFPEQSFSDRPQIGVIAQEIEKIYPELVLTDADGYKSVDYSRLTPVLVEAIKEQQKQIDELKAAVMALTAEKNGTGSVKMTEVR